ncbi:MAG: hypothetical protein OEY51_01575 [Cyclobacteriaceae bacterium]|nr:hypothetical protein [Cyclobacteriaceae bacterium]
MYRLGFKPLSFLWQRIFVGILVWIFQFGQLQAQNGDYFVSSYTIEPDRSDVAYFSIAQSLEGLIYVSNRSGILQYDGYRWERIPTPGAVYSLDISGDNFYVGGKMGAGKIVLDNKKGVSYSRISSNIPDCENILMVRQKDHTAYFMNHEKIFVFSTENDSLINIIKSEKGTFSSLMYFREQVVVVREDGSLAKVSRNGLSGIEVPLPAGEIAQVIRAMPNNGQMVIGTVSNELYLVSLNSSNKIMLKDEDYLKENILSTIEWMNDTLLAVGTLKGGVMFVNPRNGNLNQIINSHTGLKDDEVISMQKDRDNGLWVAENGGLDRIAPFLPLSAFSNYPGLNGNIISVYQFKNQLYVSTSLGLHFLDEVKDYKEIVTLVKKREKVVVRKTNDNLPKKENSGGAEKSEQDIEDSGKKRRGLFSFLKKKTPTEERESETNKQQSSGKPARVLKDSTFYVKKVNTELQSIRYIFKHVTNIDSKSSIFLEHDGRLINGGLAGIYELKGDSAIQISDTPVRGLIYTFQGDLIASTMSQEILFFRHVNGKWSMTDYFNDIDEEIYHFFEDSKGNIWMSGTDAAYKLRMDGDVYTSEVFDLENPYSDKTYIVQFGDRIYFINPNGYYYYTEGATKLYRDEETEKEVGLANRYIYDWKKNLWVQNGSRWFKFSDSGKKGKLYEEVLALNVMPDLQYISMNNNYNSYWIVNRDNKLYLLDVKPENVYSNYTLFLKEVRNTGNHFVPKNSFVIEQEKGALTFVYVQPDYSGLLGLQYRYKLSGLGQDWSEWREENQIKFPFLPPDDYSILVQTKDIFGQINESPSIDFTVVPPYWQRPWFYALELTAIFVLMSLSILLNLSSGDKNMIFNRLLALLTLVLVVEFIQAVVEAEVGAQSPVQAFFIQVTIAAAVLPFEGLLRKWLFRDRSKSKLDHHAEVLTGEEKGSDKKGAAA